MPPGSGRKKSGVWSAVQDVEGSTSKVRCLYCKMEISKRPVRIQTHLGKKRKFILTN